MSYESALVEARAVVQGLGGHDLDTFLGKIDEMHHVEVLALTKANPLDFERLSEARRMRTIVEEAKAVRDFRRERKAKEAEDESRSRRPVPDHGKPSPEEPTRSVDAFTAPTLFDLNRKLVEGFIPERDRVFNIRLDGAGICISAGTKEGGAIHSQHLIGGSPGLNRLMKELTTPVNLPEGLAK